MTNNDALSKIAAELERLNDLKELELFLNHREWSAKKYADKQAIVAEILCQRIAKDLENISYNLKK